MKTTAHFAARGTVVTPSTRLCITALVFAVMLFGAVLAVVPMAMPTSRAQAALAAPGLSLSPPSRAAWDGATFPVDIMLDCGSNTDAVAAVVSFDARYLQVVSVTPDTTQFPLALRNRHNNTAGTVTYDAGASLDCHREGTCPSGPARLATITFRTVTGTLSSTALDIHGQMTWGGAYTFDGTGNGGTVAVTIAGDVDGDCDVDIVDIMLVAARWNSVAGSPSYDSRYDLDADRDIDIVDIMLIATHWNQSCPATQEGN